MKLRTVNLALLALLVALALAGAWWAWTAIRLRGQPAIRAFEVAKPALCTMAPVRGCPGPIPAMAPRNPDESYYDAASGTCKPALAPAHCPVNANHFQTTEACRAATVSCKGTPKPSTKGCPVPKYKKGHPCPPKKLDDMWTYSPDKGGCVSTTGCREDPNTFTTPASCQAAAAQWCKTTADKVPVIKPKTTKGCPIPTEVPPETDCKANKLKWRYDPVIGKCTRTARGCQDRVNKYGNPKTCQKMATAWCGGVPVGIQEEPKPKSTKGCPVPADKPCTNVDRALRKAWRYDPTSGTCKQQRTSCYSNTNFRTPNECQVAASAWCGGAPVKVAVPPPKGFAKSGAGAGAPVSQPFSLFG